MDARSHNRILRRIEREHVVADDLPAVVARLRVFEPMARPDQVVRALIDGYEIFLVDARLAFAESDTDIQRLSASKAVQDLVDMRTVMAAMCWATATVVPLGYLGKLMTRFGLSVDELQQAIALGDKIHEVLQ